MLPCTRVMNRSGVGDFTKKNNRAYVDERGRGWEEKAFSNCHCCVRRNDDDDDGHRGLRTVPGLRL